MHVSAYINCEDFAKKYLNSGSMYEVLDVGSYDVNGTMKPIFTGPNFHYTGMDISEGPNVDVVHKDPRTKFPFADGSFDVVVSSSCFEHDECFWNTFKEMVRVCKSGGFIYINAPSTGPYHSYPVDCWRFYKDSWQSLAKWEPLAELIETYIDKTDAWENSVGIYKKKQQQEKPQNKSVFFTSEKQKCEKLYS